MLLDTSLFSVIIVDVHAICTGRCTVCKCVYCTVRKDRMRSRSAQACHHVSNSKAPICRLQSTRLGRPGAAFRRPQSTRAGRQRGALDEEDQYWTWTTRNRKFRRRIARILFPCTFSVIFSYIPSCGQAQHTPQDGRRRCI